MRKNGIEYSVRESRDRVFYPNEWKRFYDVLTNNQKLTFYTLLITGARIMEVRHIKPEHIDYDNQRLTLVRTKRRPDKKGNTKSKSRVLRVNKKLIRWFKKEEKEKNLKEDGTFKILSTPASNIAMKKALEKAGVKDKEMFSIHNIRKTSETWALAMGVDSMVLSKRFGHNLITAYMHYSQSDAFTFKEKDLIKEIFEDTFLEY